MTTQLKNIPPERIRPNDENPRMHFHQAGLDRLAESIAESGGVLVPVYVYPKGKHYVLIDGERRWRMAAKLGLSQIPALVRDDPPDPANNIVEMFNIHKVREDWDDMPTARALREVIKRTSVDDPSELRQMTGLSKEQIQRYLLALELPKRYQDMIDDGRIPLNLFVELERGVIQPLARTRKPLAREFTPAKLRTAFLAKREAGAMPDLIDLRKVRKIIDRAARDAGAPENASPLDDVLRRLFTQTSATIEEIYEESVALAVESDKLARQAEQLSQAFERLLGQAEDGPERAALMATLRSTRDALTAVIKEYDQA